MLTRHDPLVREAARARLLAGEGYRPIARVLGMPESTVRKWARQWGIGRVTDATPLTASGNAAGEVRTTEYAQVRTKNARVRGAHRAPPLAAAGGPATVGDAVLELHLRERAKMVRRAWRVLTKYLDQLDRETTIKEADARDAAIVLGILYEKIALATGGATARVEGEVTHRRVVDITQRVIADPAAVELAETLLRRAAGSDAGPLGLGGQRR